MMTSIVSILNELYSVLDEISVPSRISVIGRQELCSLLVDKSPLVDESSVSLYELSMVVARK